MSSATSNRILGCAVAACAVADSATKCAIASQTRAVNRLCMRLEIYRAQYPTERDPHQEGERHANFDELAKGVITGTHD